MLGPLKPLQRFIDLLLAPVQPICRDPHLIFPVHATIANAAKENIEIARQIESVPMTETSLMKSEIITMSPEDKNKFPLAQAPKELAPMESVLPRTKARAKAHRALEQISEQEPVSSRLRQKRARGYDRNGHASCAPLFERVKENGRTRFRSLNPSLTNTRKSAPFR